MISKIITKNDANYAQMKLPTKVSVHLLLRNDDLTWCCLRGVGDRVIQDANGPHHLTKFMTVSQNLSNYKQQHFPSKTNLSKFLAQIRSIWRITNDHAALSNFTSWSYPRNFTVFHDYLIDGLVQHVSSSIDSTQSVVPLRKLQIEKPSQ